MFDCPACSANLKFDPKTQDLACSYCGNHYDVHSFDEKKGNAEEQPFFEATVYTCPQCGGELISTDNEAAVFCSYCGASNVLESRLRHEKRPKKIIPFQISKEECKKLFTDKVRKTGFAPAELLDPEVIDSFRGIYMPYWTYSVNQHANVSLISEDVRQEGDYSVTRKYNNIGHLEASYDGYAKDASSTFYDEISDSVAPYDESLALDFHTAYMSGFYADTSDVDESVYATDAKELATKESFRRIKKQFNSHPDFKGHITDKPTDKLLNTTVSSVENVMYPVWFFSYRSKDRVAYAAINGQTGKIMADVPISEKKYYISSILMMVPIFLLLNLFFTFTPKVTLGISMGLALLTFILSAWAESNISDRENRVDDLGWQSRQMKERAVETILRSELPKDGPEEKKKNKKKAHGSGKVWFVDVMLIVSGIWGGIVLLMAPVSDLWYYSAVLIILILIFLAILNMIGRYNLMSTYKLPQFNREGGDDRA